MVTAAVHGNVITQTPGMLMEVSTSMSVAKLLTPMELPILGVAMAKIAGLAMYEYKVLSTLSKDDAAWIGLTSWIGCRNGRI